MTAQTPAHIVIPSAPRGTRVKAEVFKPYRPKDPDAMAMPGAKESPAPAPYEMEPELRAWLRAQVQILSYWDSLPDSHFVPSMPPATRARDAIVLSALRRLLA